MGTPEEKDRKRRRIRSHVTKDLHSKKYRQRVKPDDKKPAKDPKDLSHREFVELIQGLNDE